ncbi:MAG: class E sortase [Actinomycetes bacterium]
MTDVRTFLRGLGQVLITLGVVILLFCAYELWFTNLYTNREQSHLRHELPDVLSNTPPAIGTPEFPALLSGHGIAVLRIPRLGRGYLKVIVEGVGVTDLKKGPGHWPKTALPGQLGNFVVSGHRTTYGAPFNRLDEVRPGDAIVLETRTSWYVYRETREIKVSPSAVWVTDPVPGHPGVHPTQQTLTFTTCNPKYSARERLILFAALASARPKDQGPPPELAVGA